MADPNKIDIVASIETRDATKGVKSLRSEISALGPEGKKSAVTLSGSLNQVTGAIGKIRRAISTLSFSSMLINSIIGIVEKFNAWRDAAGKAAEKTRELQKAAMDNAAAENIKHLADSYKSLTDSISAASAARSRQNELFNEKLRVAREAEDAEMEAGEAEELADVDPDAADADKRRDAIRGRWAAKRARRVAERRKHDIINRRATLGAQSEADAKAADEIESSLAGDDGVISLLRRKAATLEAQSAERNEKDIRWYKPGGRTEEGDKVRDEQREEAKRLRAEVERLEKEKAAKEKQISELRAKSAHSANLADALGVSLDTADLQRSTATTKEKTAAQIVAAAEGRDAARRASALAAAPELAAQADSLRARIAAEQGRKDAANLGVFQAQNALDLARANGGKTGDLTTGLQSAQSAANEVNASADAAINALTKTLKDVEARLKAAQSFLEKESSRNAWEATDLNASNL